MLQQIKGLRYLINKAKAIITNFKLSILSLNQLNFVPNFILKLSGKTQKKQINSGIFNDTQRINCN